MAPLPRGLTNSTRGAQWVRGVLACGSLYPTAASKSGASPTASARQRYVTFPADATTTSAPSSIHIRIRIHIHIHSQQATFAKGTAPPSHPTSLELPEMDGFTGSRGRPPMLQNVPTRPARFGRCLRAFASPAPRHVLLPRAPCYHRSVGPRAPGVMG